MTVRTAAGMQRGRRVRAVALAAALGAVLVTGCEGNFGDGGEDDQTQTQDAADVEEGTEDAGEAAGTAEPEPAGPVEPPSEPADITPVEGDRDASADGGTISVDGGSAAFVTPTGGIACVVNARSAACQVLSERSFTPQGDHLVRDGIGDCSAGDADTIILSDAGGAWTCSPDELLPAAALGTGGWWVDETGGQADEVDGVEAAVLPYGQTLRVGPVSCSSEESGVTCRSDDLGRDFTVSRTSYRYS